MRLYILDLRIAKLFCLILLVAFLLPGCKRIDVANGVSQREANRIVAVLSSHGISAIANSETGGRGKYAVQVDESSYSPAVAILNDKGLPEKESLSFDELISQNGILPNSREMEALKLDHGLALELENHLSGDPEIVSVNVMIRQNYLASGQKPAVSIIIQHAPKARIDLKKISEAITRLIPGVTKDSILVSTSVAKSETSFYSLGTSNKNGNVISIPLVPFFVFWKVPKDQYRSIHFAVAVGLAVCLIFGSILGYWYGFYKQSRHFFDSSPSDIQQRLSRVERNKRSE